MQHCSLRVTFLEGFVHTGSTVCVCICWRYCIEKNIYTSIQQQCTEVERVSSSTKISTFIVIRYRRFLSKALFWYSLLLRYDSILVGSFHINLGKER